MIVALCHSQALDPLPIALVHLYFLSFNAPQRLFLSILYLLFELEFIREVLVFQGLYFEPPIISYLSSCHIIYGYYFLLLLKSSILNLKFDNVCHEVLYSYPYLIISGPGLAYLLDPSRLVSHLNWRYSQALQLLTNAYLNTALLILYSFDFVQKLFFSFRKWLFFKKDKLSLRDFFFILQIKLDKYSPLLQNLS